MKQKRVLILGASRYYSRSINAARNAGYYVIAADRNPVAEGFAAADLGVTCDIVDRDAVLSIARQQLIDAIVPVNDYGVPTAAYVAARLGIPGISEGAALLATDKQAMRERWSSTGVPCPTVAVATTPSDFERAIEKVGYPCILKPAHGIGGASRGVVVVEKPSQLRDAISFSQSFYPDKTTLVESFVESDIEHSAEVIIDQGKPHVIAISDKVKTALPYRVDKSVVYPTCVGPAQRELLIGAIESSVRALGLKVGAAHVELATTKNGPVLFELGARCGGGGTPEPIVHFSTGVDEFVETVRTLAGDKPGNLVPTRDNGCVYQFLTPAPGQIKSVSGVEEVRGREGILDVEVFVRPGEVIQPVTIGTQRAGFLIAGAPSRELAITLAHEAEAAITFQYD